jgi:glycosyltransferase involved in cell wall biosynthesis
MRIGINALQMKSADTYSKAGLSRYASSLIEALMQIETDHEFTIFVNQSFQIPDAWKNRPRFKFARTKGKLGRMPHIWGTLVASAISRRYDAWLSLAHTLPLFTTTPRVLVVHDLFSMLNPELYVARRAKITANSLRRSIAVADHLIAVSGATKNELMKHFGVPSDRITVTHLGPGNDVQRVQRESVTADNLRQLGIPWDRYLLMLSTVEPRKNVPRLLEAFSKLEDKTLGLAIAGGKGWEQSEIYNLPQKLGIQDRVKFLGYVADESLPPLFARCEAYVLPSLDEGFGITVLEAMLLGAPVVCSNTGALPEVGGEAVIYFDPTNTDDMAQAITRRLASNRDEAIAAGLQQASKFSWNATASNTLGVVEKTAHFKPKSATNSSRQT